MKYAFPGRKGGSVNISLRKEDGLFTFSVSDDGIGLAEDALDDTTGTLGFRLVRSLVSQLEGEMSVDSSAGTHFTIRFESSAE